MSSHPQHDADEVLVSRALRGDRAGFDALVARYRAGALVIARRVLGASAETEDVVQDAFMSAFLALPRLREPERFAFWLQVIVRNLALRRREALSRLRSQVLDTDLATSPESGPQVAVERNAESSIVRRAIASLPEEYALPVTLRYLHEMRLQDIANLLGLPLSLVKWRLHTGRQLLRDRLAGELMKGERTDVGD